MNFCYGNLTKSRSILITGKDALKILGKSFCQSNKSVNLKEIIHLWKCKFGEANIPEAEISTQLIASHVMKVSNLEIMDKFHNCELQDDQIEEFNRCGECRLARIPIQYIVKEWNFRDTKLLLTPPVFIPRPETEMLVDLIADNVKGFKKGLEIGSGSGAISIALLKKFPQLHMEAIDQSKAACNLTTLNAKLNQVEGRLNISQRKLENDGVVQNFKIESVDFIVSNPPYILTKELPLLEPEIKLYEDLRALDGGADGLRVVKAIFQLTSKILAPTKSCFIEIHHQHIPSIERWLEENSNLNVKFVRGFKDYFEQNRFVHVIKV